MEYTTCILCNSNAFTDYINVTDRLSSDNKLFNIVRCKCGFLYLNPRPSTESISKFYNKETYSPHFMFHKGWNSIMYDTYINIENIKSIKKYIVNNLSLKKYNNYFDVITLWHSLEHIHDIVSIFTNIKKLLKNHGILLIAIPNHNSFDRYIFKDKWAAYDAPRHLYHFNCDTFKRLCENNNINIKFEELWSNSSI